MKLANAIGSGVPDPTKSTHAASPGLPSPIVENKPAPGKIGPVGLSPRTTYSRVNVSTPQAPDFSAQKDLSPRGAEFLPQKVANMTITSRPTLQDMIKAAMDSSSEKANIGLEIARQQALLGNETKEAADTSTLTSDYLDKLANALDYIAENIKEADVMTTMAAKDGPPILEAGQAGKATSAGLPDSTGTQTEKVQSGKANTGLITNDDCILPAQPLEPIKNQKTASLLETNRSKLASLLTSKPTVKEASVYEKNLARLGVKVAEAPEATPSEQGVPSEPSDVNSQKRLIQSNEAAINYTKRQAKADPKSDVNQVLDQPALSAAHDTVLNKAWSHNSEAGPKIAQAIERVQKHTIKAAAARNLLSNLIDNTSVKAASYVPGGTPSVPNAKKVGLVPFLTQAAEDAAPGVANAVHGATSSVLGGNSPRAADIANAAGHATKYLPHAATAAAALYGGKKLHDMHKQHQQQQQMQQVMPMGY